jgi:5-methylcytosine-specific restriction enzyme subunit McrC
MISVKNLYYLLLYAWDRFDESRMIAVDAEPETDLLNLLAAVLTRGVDQLLRYGVDRGYLPVCSESVGVRGKISLSATLKSNLMARVRLSCEFDELSHDVLHNQIVKASLSNLTRCETLDPKLRLSVRTAYLRLPGVSDIRLSRRTFRNVQLHRNIRLYGLLVDICRLLYDHLIPNETTGTFRFRDFTRNEERMRRLFERFLLNFYKHELKGAFKVASRRITWAGATGSAAHLLPDMLTDITLTRPGRWVVIDAKYTPRVLQEHLHGPLRLRSEHLYQLFAYLKNLSAIAGTAVDGILLYPLAQHPIDATTSLPGHRLRAYTIDLNQHWSLIRRDLIALMAPD